MPFVLILIKVIYRRLKNMFKKFLLVIAALSIVGCTLSEVDISKKQKKKRDCIYSKSRETLFWSYYWKIWQRTDKDKRNF